MNSEARHPAPPDHRSDRPRRLATALGLVLGLGGVLGGGQILAAQISLSQERSLFSLPRSQDDIHQRKLAQQALRNGEFAVAVNQLHRLLQHTRGGIVEVAPDRYWGMRSAVIEILRDLPPKAQELYEALVQREAGGLLRSAFVGRNLAGLQVLARKFPTSNAGRRALLRLGDLYLEAGDAARASACYETLRRALPSADNTASLRARQHATAALLRPWSEEADAEVRSLSSRNSRNLAWPAYGGGWDGTRPMSALPPASEDRVAFPLGCPGYQGDLSLVAHPVGGLRGIYLNNGHKVLAYDPIAGRRRWEAPGPMIGSHGADEYHDTLSLKMLLAPSLGRDVVIAALQVPNETERQDFQTMSLTFKLPTRRLFAFDRRSGKRLWAHWDYPGGPRTRRFAAHNAPAPATVVGDVVYAPTEHYTGAISHYLSAYGLRNGEPRWRTLVCSSQLEVNMFGNARVEYAATPVAVHDGVIYGTTNLGLCYAVDAADGDLLWATAYPVIPLPRTRLRRQRTRPSYFENNPIVVKNGIMVTTPLDSEYVLGIDTSSGRILWKMYWRAQNQQENGLRWLLGTIGDEAILSGRGVIAVRLQKDMGATPAIRQIRDPQYFNRRSTSLPRGALSGDKVLFPAPDGLHVLDRDGGAKVAPIPMRVPGNLLAVDGLLLSARTNQVVVFRDRKALIEDAAARRRAEPRDPAHDLRYAILVRASLPSSEMAGKPGEQLVKVLRDGLRKASRQGMGSGNPVFDQLGRELFKLSLVRADLFKERGDQARAMKILVTARDGGGPASDWVRAQLQILALLDGQAAPSLQAWDLLANTHPKLLFRIPGLGRVPMKPYALWRSSLLPQRPEEQLRRSQALLETYPHVQFGSLKARDFARRHIQALIERHGRRIYAAIEKRAAGYLKVAGNNPTLLEAIDQRFPHSLAARRARTQVLDAAVARGDLRTASLICRRNPAATLDPSSLRRLMVAARRANNAPLAHALGKRLLDTFSTAPSDYGPDGGKTMAQLIQLRPLPQPRRPRAHLPTHELPGLVATGTLAHRVEALSLVCAPGYTRPETPLLFVAESSNRLGAYDLSTRKGRGQPRFQLHYDLSTQQTHPIYHCGDRVILNEGIRLFAVDLERGREIWSHRTTKDRNLQLLTVNHGVAQVFSAQGIDEAAGRIQGIDVQTGALLYDTALDPLGETLEPRYGLGDLWTLHRNRRTKGVELLRIDGLTGRETLRQALPTSALRQVGLPAGEDTRLDRLQAGMHIDQHGVYICARTRSNRSSPVVLALDHQGKTRWFWQSDATLSNLERHAVHRTGVVILENSRRGGRLLVLDHKTGQVARQLAMPGLAEWINAPGPHNPRTPDVVLMSVRERSSSLWSFTLSGDFPSFRFDTRQRGRFWGRPILGPDFLAVPQLDERARRMQLLVLDPKTRAGALPGGRLSRSLPDRSRSTTQSSIRPYGPFLICRTGEGILVYGNKEDSKR